MLLNQYIQQPSVCALEGKRGWWVQELNKLPGKRGSSSGGALLWCSHSGLSTAAEIFQSAGGFSFSITQWLLKHLLGSK